MTDSASASLSAPFAAPCVPELRRWTPDLDSPDAPSAQDYLTGLPLGSVVWEEDSGEIIRRVVPMPSAHVAALCRRIQDRSAPGSDDFELARLLERELLASATVVAGADFFSNSAYAGHVSFVRFELFGQPLLAAACELGDALSLRLEVLLGADQFGMGGSDRAQTRAGELASLKVARLQDLPLAALLLGTQALQAFSLDFSVLSRPQLALQLAGTDQPRFSLASGVFYGHAAGFDLWFVPEPGFRDLPLGTLLACWSATEPADTLRIPLTPDQLPGALVNPAFLVYLRAAQLARRQAGAGRSGVQSA